MKLNHGRIYSEYSHEKLNNEQGIQIKLNP